MNILKKFQIKPTFFKIISLVVCASIMFSVISVGIITSANTKEIWDGSVATDHTAFEGSGTESDPYIIENGAQLAFAVSKNPNLDSGTYYKLTKDIILNDTSVANWKESATPWIWNNHKRFNGTLDGNGHTIEGLYMNTSSTSGRIGLIAYAGKTTTSTKIAEIKNLYFKGASMTATASVEGVGIVVGQTSGETHFENIYIDETSEINAPNATGVGALAARGYNNGQKAGVAITNCAVHANITGKSAVGAFTGTYWAADAFVKVIGSYTTANYHFSGNKPLSSDSENNYGLISYEAGTTVISADEIKGDAAKTKMSRFNFETLWQTVDNGYPVQKIFVSNEENDDEPTKEVWDGTSVSSHADFQGSGTAADPYLIENGAQLYYAAIGNANLTDGSCYKLTKDIILNDTSVENWEATAKPWGMNKAKRFNGTLDGNGHTIEGLYINVASNEGRYGLFSYVGQDTSVSAKVAEIKNVAFKGASVTNTTTSSFEGVGIVAGQASGETLFENIYIDETSKVNAPNVKGVAGIIARSNQKVTINNCAVLGTYTGKSHVSSFMGTFWGGSQYINNSYSAANVPVTTSRTPTVTNTYETVKTADNYYDRDIVLLTADQMKGEAAKTNLVGFNFDTIWQTVENGYPVQQIFVADNNDDNDDDEQLDPPAVLWDGSVDSNLEGTGAEADPYLISTPAQLAYVVSTDLADGRYYKLANDIKINDTSASNWKEYAHNWVWANVRFVGNFDGDGHTIDGLYFNGSQRRIGLFSYVGDSLFKNVKITNAYINNTSSEEGSAILCGQTSASASFEEIYIDDTCTLNAPNCKGVAGLSARGNTVDETIVIKNCAVLANINGSSHVGAFLGTYWRSGDNISISNSFSASNVGIIGDVEGATAVSVTYATVGDTFGTIVLTPDQMMGEAAAENMSGLDFDSIFEVVENDYPIINVREFTPPAPLPDYVWDGTAADSFAGGTGTEDDPFIIETPEQLYKMVKEYSTRDASLNKYFKLNADVYLNDVMSGASVKDLDNKQNWLKKYGTDIPTASKANSFAGSFDGGYHTIYGLYVKNISSAGLFPALSSDVKIKNLTINNAYITGGSTAGAIAGQHYYVDWTLKNKITNCAVVNSTIGENGNIANVGGFIGNTESSEIEFKNCYSHTLNLSDSAVPGGFVGKAWTNGANLSFENCYSAGNFPVSSTINESKFVNVYTDTAVPTGNTTSTVTILTNEQMKGENAKANMLGFDFETLWQTVENAYPILNEREPVIPEGQPDRWDGQAAESFAGGSGTENDPYLIENGGQLYKMVADYSKYLASEKPTTLTYFKITKDIDLANKQWYTIEVKNWLDNEAYGLIGFRGVIDGDGHTIKGLYNEKAAGAVGLIPIATQGTEIHNLHLDDGKLPRVNYQTYTVGAFIGLAKGAENSTPITIKGCSVKNFEIASANASAAFVGYARTQSIGIYNSYCINTTITHTASSSANSAAFIAYTGGSNYRNTIIVANSYCVGVSAVPYLNDDFKKITTFENVYTDFADYDNSVAGIKKLTTEQMKGENAKIYMKGFDFGGSWTIDENGFPVHFTYVRPDYVWDGTKAESFAGGSGTENDPYLIENGAQLYKMVAEFSNASGASGTVNTKTYFKLVKDIYLNDVQESDLVNPTVSSWNSKFNSWYSVTSYSKGFCSDLDGAGFTVYGLYSNGGYSGLIPVFLDGGKIHNLSIKNSYVRGTESAGGIVGFAKSHWKMAPVAINYCSVDNLVVESTKTYVGGFVGGYGDSKINMANCSITNTDLISTNANPHLVSGFIGTGWGATHTVTNCYTDASVHPVTATLDMEYFKSIADKVLYIRVYTAAPKNYDVKGVTYLKADQMKGENAKSNFKGFDFDYVWKTVEGDYPVINLKPHEVWDGTKAESFAGGTGTSDDPFLIENGAQLYKMVAEYSNNNTSEKPTSRTYFTIVKDIDLDSKQWYTIDTTSWIDNKVYASIGFNGVIYGGGHTIKGLYNEKSAGAVGLIPVATQGAEIHDLYLENGLLQRADYKTYAVGAFIGLAKGASNSTPVVIKNCSVRNFEIGGQNAAASFIGYVYSQSVGIYNCDSVDTYLTVYASKSANAAAFIGYTGGNDYRNTIIIANSFCTDVSPVPFMNEKFQKITSFVNVYTNFADYQSNVNGITKLTTEQMQGENAKKYMRGLDFETAWKTVDNDYPVHKLYIRPENVWDGSTAKDFAGGSGTPADPYLIANGAQLYKMVSEYSNASGASGAINKTTYFKLIKDIYLNDVKASDLENPDQANWNSKFNAWYSVTGYSKGFSGDLDGDGYTVYGLYSNTGYSGLIPVLMDGGHIHNINIKNSYVRGTESAGGLVGFVKAHWKMSPVSISYCTVDNVVLESTKKFVGGIVGGYGDIKINITDCSVTRSKLVSTNENPNLVSGFIGNGWGQLVHSVANSFTDSSVHPVTATTDKESFEAISSKVQYTNVYTSAKKNFEVQGITYLASDSKLMGTSVQSVLKGFNFENDWAAVENNYPVIKKNAGKWRYDTTKPGEVWSGKLSVSYASGDGSKEKPFEIQTGGQLALLANDALNGKTLGRYYKITEDIILNDTSFANWETKANEWYTGTWAKAFRGHLDGGYHTVSGLYLNKTSDNYTGVDYYGGLFACISRDAVIEKLGITNSSLTFTHDIDSKYLGAFAGFVDQYNVENATYDNYPVIRECFADTTVYLNGGSCGGFIGCATRPIRIEDSFFTGTVANTGRGLFGYSKMGTPYEETLVKNFYAADSKYAIISNNSYDNFVYENCYSSSAQDNAGITRLFIDRMCGKAAKENMIGFDFSNVWAIRGANETPGLKGFKTDSFTNVMNPEDITVSFETNCDLVVESVTGKAYSKLELPVIEREGYVFEGWYAYAELDTPFTFDYFPTFDTILYAKWSLSGFAQDFENYEDTVYDYHEGMEYYRPTTSGYSAKYVLSGAKSMHRLSGTAEYLDFLLFYNEELEVGKTYKMVFYTTTDQNDTSVDLSLVHLEWPDVYVEPNSVQTMGTIKGLTDGKWVENTFTFVAKSKWIAIRTEGDASVYFDDFTLYNTSNKPNDSDISTPGGANSSNVNIFVIVAIVAVAVLVIGGGAVATVIVIKKRKK